MKYKLLLGMFFVFCIISCFSCYGITTDILKGRLKEDPAANYYYLQFDNAGQQKLDNDFHGLAKKFLKKNGLHIPDKATLCEAKDNTPYGFHITVNKDNFKDWNNIEQYIVEQKEFSFRVIDGFHIFVDKGTGKDIGKRTVWFVKYLEPYSAETNKYFTNIFKHDGSELHASVAYYTDNNQGFGTEA